MIKSRNNFKNLFLGMVGVSQAVAWLALGFVIETDGKLARGADGRARVTALRLIVLELHQGAAHSGADTGDEFCFALAYVDALVVVGETILRVHPDAVAAVTTLFDAVADFFPFEGGRDVGVTPQQENENYQKAPHRPPPFSPDQDI